MLLRSSETRDEAERRGDGEGGEEERLRRGEPADALADEVVLVLDLAADDLEELRLALVHAVTGAMNILASLRQVRAQEGAALHM